MTERDPNELYDALRDRLADYGQEPPAHLWANIRQQLPPPVALPQPRPRRWVSRLLAGGMASVVCLSGWWYAAQQKSQPEPVAATSIQQPAAQTGPQASTQPTTPASSTTPDAGNGEGLATIAQETAGHSGTATSESATTAPKQVAAEAAKATSAETLLAAAPATHPNLDGVPNAAEAHQSNTLPTARLAGSSRTRKTVGLVAIASRTTPTRVVSAGQSRETNPGRSRSASQSATLAKEQATSAAIAAAFSGTNAAATSRGLQNTIAAAPGSDAPGAAATAAPQASSEPAANVATVVAAGVPAPEASLLLRTPTLPLSTWPAPAVRLAADTFPHPALRQARRWAVLALAGPALTYRELGTKASEPQPTTPSTNTLFDGSGSRTSAAALERPAIGFGAQVQLRRVLNGRWTFSTGLGYHEYASSLMLSVVKTYSSPPTLGVASLIPDSTSTSTVHLRDTYRFVTVPLRLSYQLSTGRPRLHVGVQGGTDLALYVGGSSTEGSSCGCESQSWGASGSPYRALSLALSLGLDVRYEVAPRWELLAQPTATYFLNSLTAPSASYTPRQLLGGGVLLGVSYSLR